jgi:hypothetical protein
MKEQIDITGASGQVYRYRRLGSAAEAPAIAGNFLYVRSAGSEVTVVFAGEANDLAQSKARWAAAQAAFGTDGLYVRLNVASKARREERDDILAAHQPAMNGAEAA